MVLSEMMLRLGLPVEQCMADMASAEAEVSCVFIPNCLFRHNTFIICSRRERYGSITVIMTSVIT